MAVSKQAQGVRGTDISLRGKERAEMVGARFKEHQHEGEIRRNGGLAWWTRSRWSW